MILPTYRGWGVAAAVGVCLATWFVIERTRLGALLRAGTGQAPAYGTDDGSLRVQRKLADIFERDVDVLLVPTGTAANSISLPTSPMTNAARPSSTPTGRA
ncbi:hypothetical protein G6F32_015576 [Rhizopus arrhizus]|nr:hypothetical protein G6F32_015576 [Rhizopus arrhizus]